MHLQIIAASTRQERIGFPIAQWIERLAKERDDFTSELIDLREIGLPLFDEPHHPRLGKYVHEHTRRWSALIRQADGYVFVTPEYNHSFPASLKNAIDHLHNEWQFKPVGFVSYGGVAAGTRAVQHLKTVLASLQMVPVLEGVQIPFVKSLFGDDGAFNPDKGLEDAARLMLERTGFWMRQQSPLVRR
jgi:NAD(P)H-dependent FMN reductase